MGGGLQNNVTAPYATVGGGLSNTTTGIAAVIAGGSNNAATGGSAFVGGGNGNQANGNYSVVAGGLVNSATNDVAVIGGGYNNTVLALFGTIGGGGGLTSEEGNVIYDDYGTIAGGSDNQTGLAGDATTNQYYATVSGGRSNSALNRYAVIGGGYNNIVYGEFGTIGGGGSETSGDGNIIYDNYGTISGGYNNTAGVLGPTNEVFATVGGGERNRASASYTVIGAGYRNSATGNFSAVLGGSENSASGTFSTVGGGASNEATGFAATLAGGNSNGAMNVNTFVGGGLSNYANGIATVIGGGQNNTANGNYSAILGGQNNTTFGEYSLAGGGGAIAQHDGAFVWAGTQEKEGDTISSSSPNQFVVRAPGGVWFGSGNMVTMPEGAFLATDSGAYLTRGGSWANASDRALKTGFALVNGQQVLEQLAQLPIQSWNYISEGSDTRHVGPTAQDFYTAFGLGTDDKHIATVDADGIALVAIQGLHEQNRTQSDQIAALEARLAALEQGQLSTAFSPTFVIAIIAGLAAGWFLRGSLQGQKGASA